MIYGDFLAEFQAARSQALRKRMAGSPGILRDVFDAANARDARDLNMKIWIALFATVIIAGFYR